MIKKMPLEQFLNFVTIEILETLQIYPNTNVTELLEDVLYKHINALVSSNENVYESCEQTKMQ